MAQSVAAWEQTLRSTLALTGELQPSDYDRPTDCPGWTVKDVLSHLIGVERMMLGEPQPDHRLPEHLPHVRNDFGRMLEIDVDVRRPLPPEKVVAELAEVLDRRLAQLPGMDPDQEVILPTGKPGPYVQFIRIRAFDCYTHEQDIRRAVGRPGNLDAPAARLTRDHLLSGLPYVLAKRAGARPGQSLRLEVTGPIAFTRYAAVGESGRAAEVDPLTDPTASLRMDWETYLLLSTGRRTPDQVTVTVSGDTTLATRVLAGMNITP